MGAMDNFRFVSNGKKIGGVNLINLSFEVSSFEDYRHAENESVKYLVRDSGSKYCFNLANLKFPDYTRPLGYMTKIKQTCRNLNLDEPFFIVNDSRVLEVVNYVPAGEKHFKIFFSKKGLKKYLFK